MATTTTTWTFYWRFECAFSLLLNCVSDYVWRRDRDWHHSFLLFTASWQCNGRRTGTLTAGRQYEKRLHRIPMDASSAHGQCQWQQQRPSPTAAAAAAADGGSCWQQQHLSSALFAPIHHCFRNHRVRYNNLRLFLSFFSFLDPFKVLCLMHFYSS